MAVVNEHPDLNVRKLYAGQVASAHWSAGSRSGAVGRTAAAQARGARCAQRATLARPRTASSLLSRCCCSNGTYIAPWLTEELFAADVHRRAFVALASTGGSLDAALEAADPEAREVLERAAVADLDADPEIEAFNLIAAAVRRELSRRLRITDPDEIRGDGEARKQLDQLSTRGPDQIAAEALLGWLERRTKERG